MVKALVLALSGSLILVISASKLLNELLAGACLPEADCAGAIVSADHKQIITFSFFIALFGLGLLILGILDIFKAATAQEPLPPKPRVDTKINKQ